MIDNGLRYVQDRMTGFANLHREIRVFKIAGREFFAEASNVLPQVAANHQRRSRNVVDFSHVVISWILGTCVASDVPGIPRVPDHTTRLLKAPVGIDEFRTCESYGIEIAEGGDQFVKPEGRGFGIVIEEHHEFAARQLGAGIAGAYKSLVLFLTENADTIDELADTTCLVARTIIDDNDLERRFIVCEQEGTQAVIGHIKFVMDGNDDRNDGSLGKAEPYLWIIGSFPESLLQLCVQ